MKSVKASMLASSSGLSPTWMLSVNTTIPPGFSTRYISLTTFLLTSWVISWNRYTHVIAS